MWSYLKYLVVQNMVISSSKIVIYYLSFIANIQISNIKRRNEWIVRYVKDNKNKLYF